LIIKRDSNLLFALSTKIIIINKEKINVNFFALKERFENHNYPVFFFRSCKNIQDAMQLPMLHHYQMTFDLSLV